MAKRACDAVLRTGRSAITTALAMALAGCGFGTSSHDMTVRAEKNLTAHRYRAAAVDLQNLVATQPRNAHLSLELALALLHTGDYAAAEADFRKAQRLGASWSDVLSGLVETLLSEGKAQVALEELAHHAATAHLTGARADSLRGRSLLELHKLEEARPVLDRALASDPGDVKARLALASLLESQGDAAGAKAELDKARPSVHSERFSVHLAYGGWYARRHEVKEARDEFAKAENAARAAAMAGSGPWADDVRALISLAEAELMLGDVTSAKKRLERLKKLAPRATTTRLLEARIDVREKRLENARSILERLVSEEPDNEPAKVLLGSADAASGRLNQAEMDLAAATAQSPNDLLARKLLAQVQLQENHPADALKTATDPGGALDADLLSLAVRSSLLTGDLGGATRLLERHEQTSPGDKASGLELAAAYLADGRTSDAVKLLSSLDVPQDLLQRRERLLLVALIKSGAREAARTEAKRFASAHPGDSGALLLSGQALTGIRDLDSAHGMFEQAARLDPNAPQPRLALGRLELARRDRRAADAAFKQALHLDPRSADAELGEAQVALDSGDRDGAIAHLERARTIDPQNPEVQLLAAVLALDEGKVAEAVSSFEQLCARYPKSAVLESDLARAYVLARRPQDALKASARAVSLDPGYWPALALEAALVLDAGNTAQAAQLRTRLVAAGAPAAAIASLDGDIAVREGKLSEALRHYNAASAAAPSADIALKIAAVRHALRTSDPDTSLRAWLQRAPDDVRIRMRLAQYLQKEGDTAAAAREYEAVLARAPKQLIALNNLAWLRLTAGRYPEALSLAKRAYALSPGNASVADTYGWAELQSGDAAAAVALLKSAHGSSPKSAEIQFHYAVSLLKTGETADAKRELAQLLRSAQEPLSAQARTLLAEIAQREKSAR